VAACPEVNGEIPAFGESAGKGAFHAPFLGGNAAAQRPQLSQWGERSSSALNPLSRRIQGSAPRTSRLLNLLP
jgi:hypothetical protein